MIDKWNEFDYGDTTAETYDPNQEYPRMLGNEPQAWMKLPINVKEFMDFIQREILTDLVGSVLKL